MTSITGTADHGLSGRPKVSMKERVHQWARGVLSPLVLGLVRLGVHPNALTVAGCVLSLAAAMAFFLGSFRWGSALLAIGGICDALDGPLARETGAHSRFGAFFDSTLDRLGEALVLAGIAGYYLWHLVVLIDQPGMLLAEQQWDLQPATWATVAIVAILALIGSFLVSYTRARAEGLGLECKVGWFERPERLVLIVIAGAFGVTRVMPTALLILALLSFGTAVQRGLHVWKTSAAADRGAPGRAQSTSVPLPPEHPGSKPGSGSDAGA